MTTLTVTQINIYPVKSTAAVSLDSSVVEPRGLMLDRRWMLVDDGGKVITGREYPKLTQVRTQIGADSFALNAQGMENLSVLFDNPSVDSKPVTVFDDPCTGTSCGQEADGWFAEYLGTTCSLVQMTPSCVRPVQREVGGKAGDEVSFADENPVLLISEASLEDLNTRTPEPVSMRQFRPNIVVAGSAPYAEDDWQKLLIGDVAFDGAQCCKRCVFTTINADTAEKHPETEPLRTLGTYRRRDGGVAFGLHMIPRGGGTIRLGDTITLL